MAIREDVGLTVREVAGEANNNIIGSPQGVGCFLVVSERGPIKVASAVFDGSRAVQVDSEVDFERLFGTYINTAYGRYCFRGWKSNGGGSAYVTRIVDTASLGSQGYFRFVQRVAAVIKGTAAATFNLGTNKYIKVYIDGTVKEIDCSSLAATPAAATPTEIANAINMAFTSTVATVGTGDDANKVILTSQKYDGTSSIFFVTPTSLDATNTIFGVTPLQAAIHATNPNYFTTLLSTKELILEAGYKGDPDPGDWSNWSSSTSTGISVVVKPNMANTAYYDVLVYKDNALVETWRGLIDTDDIKDKLNDANTGSEYVRVDPANYDSDISIHVGAAIVDGVAFDTDVCAFTDSTGHKIKIGVDGATEVEIDLTGLTTLTTVVEKINDTLAPTVQATVAYLYQDASSKYRVRLISPSTGSDAEIKFIATGTATDDAAYYLFGLSKTAYPHTFSSVGLAGGVNPGDPSTATPFIGSSSDGSGLYSFDDVLGEVLIMAPDCPGDADFYEGAGTYCDNRGKAMYIGDTHSAATPGTDQKTNDISFGQGLQAAKVRGALYNNWVLMTDPIGSSNNPKKYVPSCGHIGGMYCRTSRYRMETVAKAPAGVTDGHLRDCLGVEYNASTNLAMTQLAEAGVNTLRYEYGYGYCVMTSRTLSTEQKWWYVNARRMFNWIASTLEMDLRWVLQEPNNDRLWKKVHYGTLRPWLLGLFESNWFGTGDFSEVVAIICDATINTPTRVESGEFHVSISIYPNRPAEKVVIELSQKNSGASTVEA